MILRTIKIIRKNDTSRTSNIHNNKFQLNSKKEKIDSFSSMKLANKKKISNEPKLILSKIYRPRRIRTLILIWENGEREKKKENSGIRVGRRLENPKAAA